MALDIGIAVAQTTCGDRVARDAVLPTTQLCIPEKARGEEEPGVFPVVTGGVADVYGYRGTGLTMLGSVRAKDTRCPICEELYVPVIITRLGWFPAGEKRKGRRDKSEVANDLGCIAHKTRPRSYVVDGRQFIDRNGISVGRLETDLNGNRFESYAAAARHLEAMRKAWDEDRNNFDASAWSNKARAEMTVEKFAPEYLETVRRRNNKTHHPENVEAIFRHKLLPRVGKCNINGFTYDMLNELRDNLEKEGRDENGIPIRGLPKGQGANGPNYVKKILRTLRAFLNWLKDKKGLIRFVPGFPDLSFVPVVGRKWVGPEEQQKIVTELRKYSLNGSMLVDVLCDMSMRPTHLLAAKKAHIMGDGIHVEYSYTNKREFAPTKNKILEVIPLTQPVLNRLNEHAKDMKDDDYLFINEETRQPFTTPELSYIFSKAAKDAEIPITLYLTVKHSTITLMREDLNKKVAKAIQVKGAWKNEATAFDFYTLRGADRIGVPTNGGKLAPDYEI